MRSVKGLVDACGAKLTVVVPRHGFGLQVIAGAGGRVALAFGSSIATWPSASVLMSQASEPPVPNDLVTPATMNPPSAVGLTE